MSFTYSCFISYRHPEDEEDELTATFVQDLKVALKSYISPWMEQGVYFDKDRSFPGYRLKDGMAQALCESVCLIVVYTPKYFSKKHTYCAREYSFMKQLDNERRKHLTDKTRSLIIPVAFRGADYIPAELKDEVLYCDFSAYALGQTAIRKNRKYVQDLNKIAKHIYKIYLELEAVNPHPCESCQNIPLPDDTNPEFQQWLSDMIPHISNTLPLRTNSNGA
jgi:TIR domain